MLKANPWAFAKFINQMRDWKSRYVRDTASSLVKHKIKYYG